MRRTEDRRQTAGVRRQKSGVRGVLRALRSPPAALCAALRAGPLFPHPSGRRGIALVLTLGILALVTLLLMAFVISMRVENMASKNFNDVIKARQLAQAAVDDAVGQLRFATPSPTINGTWVAIPGAIISNATPAGAISSNVLYTQDRGYGTVDLNNGLLITGSNRFYNSYANSAIIAGWWNVAANIGGVLQGRFAYWVDVESGKVNINYANQRTAPDPSKSPNPLTPLNLLLSDPLVDQSIPGDVDLRALEAPFYENPNPSFWLTFSNAQANPPSQPWFSTVEEMRRGLSNSAAVALDAVTDDGAGGYLSNKFFVTVGTIDTNTDAFGRDRIDLTDPTVITLANINTPSSPVRQELNDPHWATVLYPGIVTDPNRRTFEGKYGQFGVCQILANIYEYQNTAPLSAPIGNNNLDTDGIPAQYSGLKKCPMISDVVVHVATSFFTNTLALTTNWEVHVFVDVRLINIYDLPRGQSYQVAIMPQAISCTSAGGTDLQPNLWEQYITLGNNVPAHGFGLLGAPAINTYGQYLATTPAEWIVTNGPTPPSLSLPVLNQVTVRLRKVRLLQPPGAPANIVDWMSPADFAAAYPNDMVFAGATILPYIPGISPLFEASHGTPTFQPNALEKLDPRTRTFAFTGFTQPLPNVPSPQPLSVNWASMDQNHADVINNEPSWNQTYFGTTVIRDDNAPHWYGLLADARFIDPYVPNPNPLVPTLRGLGGYREGPMESLGELMFIHTGYPHRTIRLRSVIPETTGTPSGSPYADANVPTQNSARFGDYNTTVAGWQNVEANAIPDWVMLDMFKIGPAATVPGRININQRFSGPANLLRPRLVSIEALIDNTSSNLSTYFDPLPPATPLIGTNVDVLANNIATRVVATNLTITGLPTASPYAALPAYYTPGQICEVANMGYFSDPRSPPAYDTYDQNPSKTRRQQIIRRISNLITTRSNLFTIWAIAQSIKKVDKTQPGVFVPGTDIITGEVKVQAIVERYEDPNPIYLPTDPRRVKFRVKYFRYYYQ